MNCTCPHCATTYRVDPSKVPPAGVRTRCARCSGVFAITGAGVISVVTSPPAAPGDAAPAAPSPAEPEPAAPGPQSVAGPATPSVPVPARPSFGVPDPHGKARRLARALVSDIVVYHPERRERSLRSGTLRQEFREEIRKSWDEYVAQVGDEIARGTPYFRDALNDILAGGSSVF